LRHAVDDVEQHDIAKLLDAGKMGDRAADLASADQRNAITRHEQPPSVCPPVARSRGRTSMRRVG
jgi:hypothetical protein